MGFAVMPQKASQWEQGSRESEGLEGPFTYPNGRVLFYDRQEGMYWDPYTDFFVEPSEVAELQNQILDVIRGSN
jgi:hypothetical protein